MGWLIVNHYYLVLILLLDGYHGLAYSKWLLPCLCIIMGPYQILVMKHRVSKERTLFREGEKLASLLSRLPFPPLYFHIPLSLNARLFLISLASIFHFQMLFSRRRCLRVFLPSISSRLTTLHPFSLSFVYSWMSFTLVFSLQLYRYRVYPWTNSASFFLLQIMESLKSPEPHRSSYKQILIRDHSRPMS